MTWSPPPIAPAPSPRDLAPEAAWGRAIEVIARRHDLDAEGWFPFPTGSDVVWGGKSQVVKLTTPKFVEELRVEATWLRQLSGKLPWRIPRVEHSGELEGWPYLVMDRVPGQAIGRVWGSLPRSARCRLAHDLGRDVRELHRADPGEIPDGWGDFFARCRAEPGARHRARGAPRNLTQEVDAFVEEHLTEAGSDSRGTGAWDVEARVPLHTELLAEHLLVGLDNGPKGWVACIDFADACIGVPAYDFAAPVEFIFRGEPGVLRSFLLGYGLAEVDLQPSLSLRMLAWSLVHRFGSLARCLESVGQPAPKTLDALALTLFNLDGPGGINGSSSRPG